MFTQTILNVIQQLLTSRHRYSDRLALHCLPFALALHAGVGDEHSGAVAMPAGGPHQEGTCADCLLQKRTKSHRDRTKVKEVAAEFT